MRLLPNTRSETRRWLLILIVSVVLGVVQAAVLSYHALYEFASYPFPYAITLTFFVGALWYRWTTTFRETVASFVVLISVSAAVLMIVFTAPYRVLDRPVLEAFPIVERIPFGDPADVILQIAGFRTILLLFIAVPLLLITAVVLRVVHGEMIVGEWFKRRGTLSPILVVVTVVVFLLAGGMLTTVTGNYISVVDQNEASITVEGVAVADGQVTVTVSVPNKLDDPMTVQEVELFFYVAGHGWETTTVVADTTIQSGENRQITVAFPPSDLNSERVCAADQVRVDGLVSISSFDHYSETFPVTETVFQSDEIVCE